MSNLRGFALTGDTIEAAEGMLSLKDLGCVYGSPSKETLMMRTYLFDFDNTTPVAKFPICLTREYGSRLEDYVIFRDPRNNEIEVRVEKKIKRMYFRTGWFGLKDMYNLGVGGWIDLTYENPRLLSMTVKNRFDEEINYPEFDRPVICRLNRDVCEGRSTPFHSTHMIELGYSDVHSGFLSLPWYGFCKRTLSPNATEMTIIDYLGFQWSCQFRFIQHGKTFCCRFGGDWGVVCKVRGFVVGQRLELAVAKEKANNVVYLKYVPKPSAERCLPAGFDPKLCIQADASVFNTRADIGSDLPTVRLDLYSLQSYRVEFEAETVKVRMPTVFVKEHGIHIDDYVMLRDPYQNVFVVEVEKKNGKVYLKQGWLQMKNAYNIHLGAWITLTYARTNLLLMTVKDRSGVEIPYPMNHSLSPPCFTNSDGVSFVMHFFRTTVKILTAFDVLSGHLVLPWYGFCEKALPKKETTITIIDHMGAAWGSEMSFVFAPDMVYCKLGGDWKHICSAYNLAQGYAIKLAAPEESDNRVIYLTFVPLQCTHRNYVRPLNNAGGKYVYQINHYITYCPVKSRMNQ